MRVRKKEPIARKNFAAKPSWKKESVEIIYYAK